MIHQRMPLSGFTKRFRFYNDAEVAAIIEDLDLVPSFLITKELVQRYRIQLREKVAYENGLKENVKIAIAYTEELLQSDYGRELIEKYRERFSFNLPSNR